MDLSALGQEVLAYLAPLWLAVLGVFFGALVQRATGMGYGIIAGGPMLAIFSPLVALIHLAVTNIALSSASAFQLRQDIDWRVVRSIVPGLIVGSGVGIYLSVSQPRWVILLMALMVIAWAITETVIRLWELYGPKPEHPAGTDGQGPDQAQPLRANWKGGFIPASIGGALSFTVSMPGPAFIGYVNRIRLTPLTMRATMLSILTSTSVLRVALNPFLPGSDDFRWIDLGVISAICFLGLWAGQWVGRVLPPVSFIWVQLVFMLMSIAVVGYELGAALLF